MAKLAPHWVSLPYGYRVGESPARALSRKLQHETPRHVVATARRLNTRMRKFIDIISETTGLPAIIRQVRDTYNSEQGIATKDIANGACEDFARDVLNLWQGDDWVHHEGQGDWYTVETLSFAKAGDDGVVTYPVESWDWDLLAKDGVNPETIDVERWNRVISHEPNHIWICYQGRHYDAEAPDGVETPFELPFFQRWYANIR